MQTAADQPDPNRPAPGGSVDDGPGVAVPSLLDAALVEIEQHVDAVGWDQAPQLFALVATTDLLREQPELAGTLGVTPGDPALVSSLTPVEQDPLPDGPLDLALGSIEWPAAVRGCALVQEVLALPPDAEAAMPGGTGADEQIDYAASHPHRQEIRLAVAVLRDGTRSATARVRATGGLEADPTTSGTLMLGPDLAPELAAALLATLG